MRPEVSPPHAFAPNQEHYVPNQEHYVPNQEHDDGSHTPSLFIIALTPGSPPHALACAASQVLALDGNPLREAT